MSQNDEFVKDKLLLLYMLKKFRYPVSSSVLLSYLFSNKLIDFFQTIETLSELNSNGYIYITEKNGESQYEISQSGLELLATLQDMLPKIEASIIDNLFSSEFSGNKKTLTSKVDYSPLGESRVTVEYMVYENDIPFFELKFAVPSIEDARSICKNLEDKSSDIYMKIIDIISSP
jgi:predicted transcriptional regulator